MRRLLSAYREVAGEEAIDELLRLATPLAGMRVVHVNSAASGGGVAEILESLVPMMRELGLEASWHVVEGGPDFFKFTKTLHHGLQGNRVTLPTRLLRAYEETAAESAEKQRKLLEEAEIVFVHDQQPLGYIAHFPGRRGKWIWRCHIDVANPDAGTWAYLKPLVDQFDASVFSLAEFVRPLPHPTFLISPGIDPLSEKNSEMSSEEMARLLGRQGLDPAMQIMLQVSRYDHFKDPIGVIDAYRLARRHLPRLQLVLAGGGATDDPEWQAVLEEVRAAAGNDGGIHLLVLPPDDRRTVNALQRSAGVVLQKSIREGFGLTVAEAMWKGKPVIGGDTGGIRLQVRENRTGFLVNSPASAARRVRHLLENPGEREEMGRSAREWVRQRFLLTRQCRDYLALMGRLTGRL